MSKHLDYQIATQGHWWVNSVSTTVRKPGFLKIEADLQQKYPELWTSFGDRELLLIITHRDDQTPLHMRDGEDGSENTTVKITLPRTLPWKRWSISTDQGRYSVQVVAWTEGSMKYGLQSMIWMWKARRRARKS